MDIPVQQRYHEEISIPEEDENKVSELPSKLQTQDKGRIKKSASVNYPGHGGFEVEFQQSPKKKDEKNKNKKKKKKTKSIQEGKSTDAIMFLDLKLFKVKQCTAGTNHNPKKCLNYHDFKRDRRRPIGSYSSEACVNVSKGGE